VPRARARGFPAVAPKRGAHPALALRRIPITAPSVEHGRNGFHNLDTVPAAKGERETAKTRAEDFMKSIRAVDDARAMLKLLAEHFKVPPVKFKSLRDKRNRRGEAAGRYGERTRTIRIWPDSISRETWEALTNGATTLMTMTLDSVLCHDSLTISQLCVPPSLMRSTHPWLKILDFAARCSLILVRRCPRISVGLGVPGGTQLCFPHSLP
jgi:hypothetical protein